MFKGKLDDIVRKEDGLLRGPFGSALKKSLFVPKSDKTYKVYEQGVVLQEDDSVGNYYISEEYFKSDLCRFEVKGGDFLVSCSGVNYGAIYQLPSKIEPGVINQALLRIRLNNEIIDDNYFLYYFKTYIVKKITTGTGDSTIPNFPPMSIIKDIDIELPDIKEQKRIGLFLKSIDNKISINKHISSLLESLSRRYYEDWFIKFRFTDLDNKKIIPRKADYAYNSQLHFITPSSWKIDKIGSIIVENEKSKVQVGKAKNKKGDIPFFTSGEDILPYDKPMVSKMNIYLNTGGNADIKYYYGDAAYSTDTWCITGNSYVYYLLFNLLSIKNDMDNKLFEGTGLKHLQKDLFKDRKILIPPLNIIIEFNKLIEKNIQKISDVYRENRKLYEIRDYYMRALISGQVTINE